MTDRTGSPRAVYADANEGSIRAMRDAGQLQRLNDLTMLDVHYGTPASPSKFLSVVDDAEIVIIGGALPDLVLRRAPKLELVCFVGQGAANFVNLPLAASRGIKIAVTPGYGTAAVSEHVLALLFGVARRISEGDRHVRENRWRPFSPGTQLAGKTVGIIGYGDIGAHTASLLNALGTRVLVWTRSPPAGGAPGVQFKPLNDLLKESDVVSLHLELNEQTNGMITGSMLDLLKRGAILINTARAELIEEGALERRLTDGVLSAGLDVFITEPPLQDNPLLKLNNVVLSPHQGYHTPEAFAAMLEMVVDNVRDHVSDSHSHPEPSA
ncbi:2-hydroxyacid dehydrogenase [Arthrobacter sp. CAL618]|uniref:2-hydroxyacid dehydrogenase n=1 Tax=Arthrobacter sp. CAL618 TaxID=1055770 RepID=UPI000557D51A|nr:NAD(P)-dependent oxidoreductase [Arthrobacter sp. CAL618]